MDKKQKKEIFGEYLQKLRKHKNVSVKEMARGTGISDPFLYQVESGKKSLTSPEYFNRLARYFQIDVSELLKKAGYIQEDDEETKINKAFDSILKDPQFKFGSRMRGKYDLEAKKFIVEMYEKLRNNNI